MNHETSAYGLWSLVILNSLVFHFRIQLHQARDRSRLALARRILGVRGRSFYRNVWLPANDLSAAAVVVIPLPRSRFPDS